MNPGELSTRLWQFAARVSKVVAAPPDTRVGRPVAGRLVPCGASAPPNDGEGGSAGSRNDFIHKWSIALRELKATRGWLRLLTLAGHLSAAKGGSPVRENEGLVKIPGKSVATARPKSRRPPDRNP